MDKYVWLDVSVVRCPNCGKMYSDASWYVLDMESDIECTECGHVFNTRKNLIDRVLIRLSIKDNRVDDVTLEKHLSIDINKVDKC